MPDLGKNSTEELTSRQKLLEGEILQRRRDSVLQAELGQAYAEQDRRFRFQRFLAYLAAITSIVVGVLLLKPGDGASSSAGLLLAAGLLTVIAVELIRLARLIRRKVRA